jgi:hypothetical protein
VKLLFCGSCLDIISLAAKEKACTCGKSRGAYDQDLLHAWYSGASAIPLGFTNTSFGKALRAQPLEGLGADFVAFVIPKACPTFRQVRRTAGGKAKRARSRHGE